MKACVPSVKKNPYMPEILPPHAACPCSLAAAKMPSEGRRENGKEKEMESKKSWKCKIRKEKRMEKKEGEKM